MNCTLEVNVKERNVEEVIATLKGMGLSPIHVRNSLYMECNNEESFWKFIDGDF
jgi:hypothetical protein